jgi:hypothetical protein
MYVCMYERCAVNATKVITVHSYAVTALCVACSFDCYIIIFPHNPLSLRCICVLPRFSLFLRSSSSVLASLSFVHNTVFYTFPIVNYHAADNFRILNGDFPKSLPPLSAAFTSVVCVLSLLSRDRDSLRNSPGIE